MVGNSAEKQHHASGAEVCRALFVGIFLLLSVGCGEVAELPAPGANGLVVVHVWDEPGTLPTRIEAERIHQQGTDFRELDLERVRIRLPKHDGVVYVTAPAATYSSGAVGRIVLRGNGNEDGPIRFNGLWRGQLFAGRANGGSFDQRTKLMILTGVEIESQGLCQAIASTQVREGQSSISYGATTTLSATKAMSAALAALPQPLALPEMKTK